MRDLAAQFLGQTRTRFDAQRRAATWFRKPSFAKPKAFADRNDKRFDSIFNDHKLLLSGGRVRWGAIVQANSRLFGPKAHAAPACIVYVDSDTHDAALTELSDFARWLFGFKGSQGVEDEFLIQMKRVLEDEFDTPMNVRVPERFWPSVPVYFTSIVVFPDHLPVPHLKFTWFPVLALPERTSAVVIVPSRNWSRTLTKIWRMPTT